MANSEFISTGKRIYFRNLGEMKWTLVPLILGLILMFSDLFNWFKTDNWSLVGLIGQLLILLTLLIMFAPYLIRRQAVQWNEIGMGLKLDSIFGIYIPFYMVTGLEKKGGKLNILLTNGKEHSFKVDHINEADIDKLMKVIRKRMRNG